MPLSTLLPALIILFVWLSDMFHSWKSGNLEDGQVKEDKISGAM